MQVEGITVNQSLLSHTASLRVGIDFLSITSFYGNPFEPTVECMRDFNLRGRFDMPVGSELRQALFTALGSSDPQDSDVYFVIYALNGEHLQQLRQDPQVQTAALGSEVASAYLNLLELAKAICEMENPPSQTRTLQLFTQAGDPSVGSLNVRFDAHSMLRVAWGALLQAKGDAASAIASEADAVKLRQIFTTEEANLSERMLRAHSVGPAAEAQRSFKESSVLSLPSPNAAADVSQSPSQSDMDSFRSTPARRLRGMRLSHDVPLKVAVRLRVKRDGSARVSLALKVKIDRFAMNAFQGAACEREQRTNANAVDVDPLAVGEAENGQQELSSPAEESGEVDLAIVVEIHRLEMAPEKADALICRRLQLEIDVLGLQVSGSSSAELCENHFGGSSSAPHGDGKMFEASAHNWSEHVLVRSLVTRGTTSLAFLLRTPLSPGSTARRVVRDALRSKITEDSDVYIVLHGLGGASARSELGTG